MVDGVGASRRGSVVTGRRIGEVGEGERVGVKQRWGEPPWFIRGSGRWVLIPESFMAEAVASTASMMLARVG